MMKIKNAMQKEVISFQSTDRIIDVAQGLRKNKISGAPVVDEGQHVVGIISEGDIMRLLEIHSPKINLILPSPLDLVELPIRMKTEFDDVAEDLQRAGSVIIGDIMTKKVTKIDPESNIADAAELMDKHDIKRLPVVDKNDKLLGIITRGDIIAAMVRVDE